MDKATPDFNCTLVCDCELHGNSHLMPNGEDSARNETALLDEVSIALENSS